MHPARSRHRQPQARRCSLTTVDPEVWQTVRSLERGNVTLRVTDAPMNAARTIRRLDEWSAAHGATQVQSILEPLRGLVRVSCKLPDIAPDGWSLPERAIAERLPARLWHSVRVAPV